MVTRRPHTKSRNGCDHCKRRKVKCDEARPTCFNCLRHSVVCSFSEGPQQSKSSPSGLTIPFASYRPVERLPPLDEIWGRGLELMHHYTVSTANTLAQRPDMQHTWRVTIPEMAFRCPFVMHGLLAIAALHKAHLLPAQREAYLDLAAFHQNSGLEGFQAALEPPPQDNWKNHFLFASTIALSVCTLPFRTQMDGQERVPSTLELFAFVKGMRALIQPYQSRLWGTTLGPLVTGVWIITERDPCWSKPVMELSPLPGDIFEAMGKLREFFETSLTSEVRTHYFHALDELEKAVYLVAHAGSRPEIGMFMSIPYALPNKVMVDIEALSPHGLILLSYIAVLSRVLEAFFWFMDGWSRRVFSAIDANLPNDASLMSIISWPRRQVFGF